ncbi:MAG: hypothetical protein DRN20_06185 [Thermoplasmata archaeon]|nr:MAG: hypothetical protein DRN20_06185 [Thermoplasmata archaeon]
MRRNKYRFYWQALNLSPEVAGDVIARVDNYCRKKIETGWWDSELIEFINDTFPTKEEAIIAAYHAGRIAAITLMHDFNYVNALYLELTQCPEDVEKAIKRAIAVFKEALFENKDVDVV